MSQVHAPYHFVPLSKWVYMPDWAHLVSHDVPFKDGLSGSIEYTLTNRTPMCVGAAVDSNDNPKKLVWSKDPFNNLLIPSTTMKGVIRSVLEIASFAKFNSVDNRKLSYRTVGSKSKYLEFIKDNGPAKPAWIKWNPVTQSWELRTCQFVKVYHKDLKDRYGVKIENTQSAVEKYKLFNVNKEVEFDVHTLKQGKGDVLKVTRLGTGGTKGNVVFCNNRIIGDTGNPQFYEFSYCFYGNQRLVSSNTSELDDIVQSCFESHDEEQVQYLKANQHAEYGIPVFALFDKKTRKLAALGLSKMPRLMYSHSFDDLTQRQQVDAKKELIFDLPECMFGTLRDKGLSLKSRVIFSDLVTTASNVKTVFKTTTLGEPKPSFLATYLEQPVKNKHADYNEQTSRLAGWKRYKVQSKLNIPEVAKRSDGSINTDIQTNIEWLEDKADFKGRVVFHNLKREELAALVWSLTLGESGSEHLIGHGKSLGAGRVSLRVDKVSANGELVNVGDLNTAFSQLMNSAHPGNGENSWIESPQIKHLLAIQDIRNESQNNNSYIDFNASHKPYDYIKNNQLGLAELATSAGSLGRKEDSVVATAATSFGRGRLATLVTDDVKQSTWFKSKKSFIEDLEKEREKQNREAEMATLDDDAKAVMELWQKLETSEPQARQHFNAEIIAMSDRAKAGDFSVGAIQRLVELIENKDICTFLSVGKKKIKDHKKVVSALRELANA